MINIGKILIKGDDGVFKENKEKLKEFKQEKADVQVEVAPVHRNPH